MSGADPHIPITLLTGFLGAGKTTLLNNILAADDGPRIAVIVNEFGEAGLDHDLIEAVGEDIVLMQSGCLCCSIRGDLSNTLKSLMERKRSGAAAFDRVVIETTGLADPGPVLNTLVADGYLSETFRIDGVVTVADAATGQGALDRQFEAVSQVAMADMLVVSKTDLVTAAEARAFEARLRALNPTARMQRADHGAVPVASLWDLSGMRRDGASDCAMKWLGHSAAAPAEQPIPDSFFNLSGIAPMPAASPRTRTHGHDARIGSASIVLDHPISLDTFDLWLNTLIMLRGPNILRVKGIVHVETMIRPSSFTASSTCSTRRSRCATGPRATSAPASW